MSVEETPKRTLYNAIEPFITGFLQVSKIHNIYWEVSGNSEGKPVMILHGGPGSGSSPMFRQYFDPEVYRIVQMDQRGSGLSEPFASLEENTTQDLVEDIEKLRQHLNIDKWHTVYGGSWGSTLSLVYAQTHPERVGHLIMTGIFMCRKSEIDFYYQEGSSWLFPEHHENLRCLLPEVEQGNILQNYYLKLIGDDEEEQLKFAKAWDTWEVATLKLIINEERLKEGRGDKFTLAHARIEAHYFINGGFFRNETQLLDDCNKIQHIPTVIIQGRYDAVCPAKTAWELYKQLPNSKIIIIPDAGHSGSELGTIDAIVSATDKFKENE